MFLWTWFSQKYESTVFKIDNKKCYLSTQAEYYNNNRMNKWHITKEIVIIFHNNTFYCIFDDAATGLSQI